MNRLRLAVRRTWRHGVALKGRAGRLEYWAWLALGMPVGLAGWAAFRVIDAVLAAGWLGPASLMEMLTVAALGFWVVPMVTVSVRRFHDVGLSGWWVAFLDAGLLLVPLMVSGAMMARVQEEGMVVAAYMGEDRGSADEAVRWLVFGLFLVKSAVALMPGTLRANPWGPSPRRVRSAASTAG